MHNLEGIYFGDRRVQRVSVSLNKESFDLYSFLKRNWRAKRIMSCRIDHMTYSLSWELETFFLFDLHSVSVTVKFRNRSDLGIQSIPGSKIPKSPFSAFNHSYFSANLGLNAKSIQSKLRLTIQWNLGFTEILLVKPPTKIAASFEILQLRSCYCFCTHPFL